MGAGSSATRTRASTPEEMDARRTRILAATARVIVARGVDATRLADVADEADVSIGLIQHYFRNRQRLVLETFRHAIEQSRAQWRGSVESVEDPVRRLARLARFTVTGEAEFSEAWGIWLEFFAASTRHPELGEHVQEMMNVWRDLFVETISAGVASGRLQPEGDVEGSVTRLVAMIDGMAIHTLLGLYGMTPERMETLILDAVADEFGVDRAALAAAQV